MKKFISLLVVMAMLMSMAPAVFATESTEYITYSADFATFNGGSANTSYSSYTTSNGWALTNGCVYSLNGALVPVLNGKTAAVGQLVSPTLTGGIQALSISYTNVYGEKNGVDITVTVTYGENTVTKQIDDDSVTQGTAETVEWTLEEAITGDFTITVDNNSPTASTSNKDRVAITALSWTSMESAASHVHDQSVMGSDETGHWTMCSCGDESTKSEVEPHTVEDDDYVCSVCGYVVEPDTDTLTIADALKLAKAVSTSGTAKAYYITGTVTKIVNENYGNLYIGDAEGNSLYVYGLVDENGKYPKDGWTATMPEVGDSITIYAELCAYGSTLEAVDATFTINPPTLSGTGVYGDPYVIPVADGTEYTFNGYSSRYLTYTATASGKLTFTMTSDSWSYFMVTNANTGFTSSYLYKSNGYTTYTIDMNEGDVVNIVIGTGTYSSSSAVDISFTVSFEECEIDPSAAFSLSSSSPSKDITVAADTRFFCSIKFQASDAKAIVTGPDSNFYVMIGETKYEPDENGVIELPFEYDWSAVNELYLYNTGDAEATYTFEAVFEEGSENNPEEITEPGSYTAETTEDSYYYSFTAPADGIATITMTEGNWYYMIEHYRDGESVAYEYGYYEDGDPDTVTFEMLEGDYLEIRVQDYDYVAVSFTLAFEEGHIEPYYNLSADTWGGLPATSVEIPADSWVRYEVYSCLTDGGMLTISGATKVIVGGTGVYNEETGKFEPEGGTEYLPSEDGLIYVLLPNEYDDNTVHIYNGSDAAITCDFNYYYPQGTYENPVELELVENTASGSIELEYELDEYGDSLNKYYYSVIAPEEGFFTLTITSESNWGYNLYNDTKYYYPGDFTYTDDPIYISYDVAAYEGDEICFYVYAVDADATISFDITFTPATISGEISGYSLPADLEIPVGESYYSLKYFYGDKFSLTASGVYIESNGYTYVATDGVILVPANDYALIKIVNNTDAVITASADAVAPLGAYDNPETLYIPSTNTCTPAGAYEYYFYTYTAEQDCTVVLTPEGSDWYIDAETDDYSVYESASAVEGDTSLSVTLTAGQVLTIKLYREVEGSITFTAEFGEAGETVEYVGDGGYLGLGDNFVEVEMDAVDGATWTYTALQPGTLVISLTALSTNDGLGWTDGTDYIDMNLAYGRVYLYINGEPVTAATTELTVATGDEVTVAMTHYMTNAIRATLNLSMKVHDASDGTLALGYNELDLETGTSGEWTYTAEEEGTLILNLTGGYVYDDWFGTWQPLAESELPLIPELFSLTINDVTYTELPAEIEVAVGDTVVVSMTNTISTVQLTLHLSMSTGSGTNEDPFIIELPTEIVFAPETDEEAWESVYYSYTADAAALVSLIVGEGANVSAWVNGELVSDLSTIILDAGDELLIAIDADTAGTYSILGTLSYILSLGDNTIDQDLSYCWIAEEDCTLTVTPIDLLYWDSYSNDWVDDSVAYLGEWAYLWMEDTSITEAVTVEVKAGDILYFLLESIDGYAYQAVVNLSAEAASTDILWGDVNGDGLVDTDDAMLIAQYDVGLIDEAALNLAAGDVNGDGLVDTDDAMLIAQFDVGLVEKFPVEN